MADSGTTASTRSSSRWPVVMATSPAPSSSACNATSANQARGRTRPAHTAQVNPSASAGMTNASPSGTWTTAGCKGRDVMKPPLTSRVSATRLSDDTVPAGVASSHERAKDAKTIEMPASWAVSRTNVRAGTLVLGIALFGAIAGLIGVDVAADYRSGTAAAHLLTEGVVMTVALLGVVTLWRQLSLVEWRAERLSIDLEAARR